MRSDPLKNLFIYGYSPFKHVAMREKGNLLRYMYTVHACMLVCVFVCVQLARSPRLAGLGVAEGHGSVHPSAAAGHKDRERGRERRSGY